MSGLRSLRIIVFLSLLAAALKSGAAELNPSELKSIFQQKLIHPGILFPDLRMPEYGFFGWAAAMEGNTIVLSAPGVDQFRGQAFVFEFVDGKLVLQGELRASDANPMNFFGNSLAIYGKTIAVGANNNDGRGEEAGAVYLFEKPDSGWRTMTETVKLSAREVAQGDSFGFCVFLTGNRLAVGAPYTDAKGVIDVGRVYLYSKSDRGWTADSPYEILSPAASTERMWYGTDVSMDGETLAVGASASNQFCGSAYLYEKRGATMQETAILEPQIEPEKESDFWIEFGRSVSLSGDTLAVGTNTIHKAAYVYVKPAEGWANATASARLTSSKGYINIGGRVQVAGDYVLVSDENTGVHLFEKPANGWTDCTELAFFSQDQANGPFGFAWRSALSENRILVGARSDSQGEYQSGSAFLYQKKGERWGENDRITYIKNGHHAQDQFGYTIAVDGDTAAIGVPQKNEAFVYVYENEQWNLAGTLTPGESNESGQFGKSVAISGDTIAIGAPSAPMENGNDHDRGMVYVFEQPARGWSNMTPSARLYPSTQGVSNEFGAALAISGNTLAVGDPQSELLGFNSGAVYIFEKSTTGWTTANETAVLHPEALLEDSCFGYSLAMNVNTLAVGSGMNPQVFVFEKNGNWRQSVKESATLEPPPSMRKPDSQYGFTLAMSDEIIAVGAPSLVQGEKSTGAVFIYNKTDKRWISSSTEDAILLPPENQTQTQFGFALALDGERLIVGAPSASRTLLNAGAAYLYARVNRQWNPIEVLSANDPAESAFFGRSVALKNGRFLIGAPLDNDGGVGSGSAYASILDETNTGVHPFTLY